MREVSFENIRSRYIKNCRRKICTTVADGGTNFVRFAANFASCECNLSSSDAKRKKHRKRNAKRTVEFELENRQSKVESQDEATCDSSCDYYLSWALVSVLLTSVYAVKLT